MPLVERTIVDLREEMVLRAMQKRGTMESIAREFGVSVPTLRLWRERYGELGRRGLTDRSHAPHCSPLKTDPTIEAMILAERRQFRFGSKKILQRLRDAHPDLDLPARSTIDGILARNGLVEHQKPRRVKANSPFIRRYEATESGELMTLDHKGQFRMGNGVYCFPLTICDSFTRYVMACEALGSTQLSEAWPVIERVLREWGMPRAVQSDNGPPFGSPQGKFSLLSVRFMSLGVQPVFSRPGRPGDNGRHERMHRDLKRDATRPPGRTMGEQQRRLDEFRHVYNNERPHESLSGRRPAHLFKGSPRPFPRHAPKPDYAPHLEKRKVTDVGTISWRGQHVFISETLRGQTVGLELVPNALVQVHFYTFVIGMIDEETLKFH